MSTRLSIRNRRNMLNMLLTGVAFAVLLATALFVLFVVFHVGDLPPGDFAP